MNSVIHIVNPVKSINDKTFCGFSTAHLHPDNFVVNKKILKLSVFEQKNICSFCLRVKEKQ